MQVGCDVTMARRKRQQYAASSGMSFVEFTEKMNGEGFED